jgi:hypothetical protein
MKSIDLGAQLRILIEDYTYGTDELFYQNIANNTHRIAMDDGIADGDEKIDFYSIAFSEGSSVLDVMASFFPYETNNRWIINRFLDSRRIHLHTHMVFQ